MADNKSGVVVLSKPNKKIRFNPDLKNTMSSVVGGAGETSLPNSAPTPTGGVAASGGTGAVMASVSNDMFLNFMNALKTPDNTNLIEAIENGYKIIVESGSYEYDDITDLEHPDDIERAFYGEDEPEEVDPQLDEYNKYIDELANIIRRYGYWSSQVREFNDTVPSGFDISKIHTLATRLTREY